MLGWFALLPQPQNKLSCTKTMVHRTSDTLYKDAEVIACTRPVLDEQLLSWIAVVPAAARSVRGSLVKDWHGFPYLTAVPGG